MAKTKRLAEQVQEESLAQIQPLENLETIKAAPRIIKMRALTIEHYDQLVKYLQTRPYNEVAGLVHSLSQSPVLDVTVHDK